MTLKTNRPEVDLKVDYYVSELSWARLYVIALLAVFYFFIDPSYQWYEIGLIVACFVYGTLFFRMVCRGLSGRENFLVIQGIIDTVIVSLFAWHLQIEHGLVMAFFILQLLGTLVVQDVGLTNLMAAGQLASFNLIGFSLEPGGFQTILTADGGLLVVYCLVFGVVVRNLASSQRAKEKAIRELLGAQTERIQELSVSLEVARMLNAGHNPDGIKNLIVDILVSTAELEACVYLDYLPAGKVFAAKAARGLSQADLDAVQANSFALVEALQTGNSVAGSKAVLPLSGPGFLGQEVTLDNLFPIRANECLLGLVIIWPKRAGKRVEKRLLTEIINQSAMILAGM